jgi:hypothetical protein
VLIGLPFFGVSVVSVPLSLQKGVIVKAQGLISAISQALPAIITEMLGRKVNIEGEISISDLFFLHLGQHLDILLVHVRLGEGVKHLLVFVFLFLLADGELLLDRLEVLLVLFLTNIYVIRIIFIKH